MACNRNGNTQRAAVLRDLCGAVAVPIPVPQLLALFSACEQEPLYI